MSTKSSTQRWKQKWNLQNLLLKSISAAVQEPQETAAPCVMDLDMNDEATSSHRNIKYDGKTVAFKRIEDGQKFIVARRRYQHTDVCPLCKITFTPQSVTAVVLIVSNQAGIPNRVVHEECLEDKTDEYAFRLISMDYKESKAYADWFPS